MKQYAKRQNQQRISSNAAAVARTSGTASRMPPPSRLKGAGTPIKRPPSQSDQKLVEQDYDGLGREQQYQYRLILADFQPDRVQGFDEFKRGGFRYNPSKSYNLKITEQQLGYRPVAAQGLGEYWADPGTEAGRIMKRQHQNHGRNLLYGKVKGRYQPSDELLSRQVFQQLGEEQVKQNILALLQYCRDIKKAIQLKISDEATTTDEKINYLAKGAKIDTAIDRIL